MCSVEYNLCFMLFLLTKFYRYCIIKSNEHYCRLIWQTGAVPVNAAVIYM